VILGILSDTHGQHVRTRLALQILERLGATAFAHCGDVGGVDVLTEFAGRKAWVVCGNTDCPDAALLGAATGLGISVTHSGPARFTLAGRQFALFHGHEGEFERLLGALAETGAPPTGYPRTDFVLHGHTHLARADHVGGVTIINPGALHRATTHTVATLDLPSGDVQFWAVAPGAELAPVRYAVRTA
jgi:uncharacterized protein